MNHPQTPPWLAESVKRGGSAAENRFKDASIKGTPVWTSPFYCLQSAFGSLVPIGNSAAEDAGYASLQMVH